MTIRIKKNIIKMQKIIVKPKYQEFDEIVNDHLSNGWTVMHGTFQICGVGENEDYEFRYGVVLEKTES
jgi:hypothetical protein